MAVKKKSKKKPIKTPPKKKAPKPVKFPKRTRAQIQTLIPIDLEPETMITVEIETEKKLSAKIIVGKRIGKITAPTDLFTVIGIATGTKVGQSTYGEWVGLRGNFEVVRCDDGKVLTAPLLILPELEYVFAGDPIEFAVLLSVDPSTNQQGFEYRLTWIVQPRPHDGLAALREAKQHWMGNYR